jgi:Rieske 2Fe-2S family protein
MSDALHALLSRRRPGHSLEAAFYTSDDIFRADLDRIFARHWIFVGQEPDLPHPGDIRALTIGEAPILLVRGEDNAIRAFHNVCRHRGAQLVAEGASQAARLVCRYHAWTYGLDGSLLFANHMGEDFDGSCRGLHPVALRSIAGLLFVCLAADPPGDIDEMAAAMEPYLRPHRIAETRIARQVDIVENGNWKLTLENNRECYHCAANHPELTVPLFSYGFGFAPASLDAQERAEAARYDAMVEDLHGRWEGAGLPSRRIEKLTGRATGFRTERLPLDRAGESHTADTRVACRVLLGGMTDKRSGGLSFWTQPNSWHHFMSDHAVTFCVLPLSADRTLVRTTWLVHRDAVEGVDYDPANLTAVWEATNRQDAALVEITQAGVRSPAYAPGPYSPHTEGLVEDFCTWYVERMLAAEGRMAAVRPAETRAPPIAPAAPPPAEATPAVAAELYNVTFSTTNRSIVCPSDRTVLQAARAENIALPFSCGKGLCGTCKSRILSGTVEMKHRGGIRQRDIDDGFALLCCSRPTSDLVIER